MEEIEFDFKDFLQLNDNITFLAGAGISVNPPSSLASAHMMMDAIIRFCCPENVYYDLIEKKAISGLKYEYLIGLFRDAMDKNLKILDYFTQTNKPNGIHKFLAEKVCQGNVVMTTNFDCLIEYALRKYDDKARVVITEEDFISHSNPVEMARKGINIVYKLHGSQRNVFSGQETRESVITTLDTIAKNKEGDIFALPQYERQMFKKACEERILVVIGYSGGDVFDIIPTLMHIPNIEQIIWIEHTSSQTISNKEPNSEIQQTQYDSNKIKIFSYKKTENEPENELQADHIKHKDELVDDVFDKHISVLDNLLYNFSDELNKKVIKIQGDTEKIISEGTANKIENAVGGTMRSPYDWIKKHFKQIDEGYKEYMAATIYFNYGRLKKALVHFKNAYKLHHQNNKRYMMSYDLGQIGLIYYQTGEIDKAIEKFNESLKISQNLQATKRVGEILGKIGNVYKHIGNAQKALEILDKSYEIHETLDNKLGMANSLGNISLLYLDTGKPQKALEYQKKAYNIDKQLNNMKGMAEDLGNLGVIFMRMGKIKEALEHLGKSRQIHKELVNLKDLATVLGSIGLIFMKTGKLNEALKKFNEAYNLHVRFKNYEGMSTQLSNMAHVYADTGKYENALKYHKKALEIDKKTKNSLGIADDLGNIGYIYVFLREFKESLKYYQESLKMHKQLENSRGVANQLTGIGNVYMRLKDSQNALKNYETAYKINEKLQNLEGMAEDLGNIGSAYLFMGDDEEALKYYNKTLQIEQKLNNMQGMASTLGNIGAVYRERKDYDNALKYFNACFGLSMKIGFQRCTLFALQNIKQIKDKQETD
ncbi:MAG: tetratricopeptide repeat protein [Candidatus Lokiarchaeota archaeon]|nr:tetratricopeptide repeat protein [Candidatus Lokiarchaeota archaeon]